MSISKNSEDFYFLPPDKEVEKRALSIGLTPLEYEQMHSKYHCNLLRNAGEWSGGTLYLLNFAIKFVPHQINFDQDYLTILNSDIVSTYFFNRSLIIPNGLAFKLKNGREIRLTVEKRNQIVDFINSKIK